MVMELEGEQVIDRAHTVGREDCYNFAPGSN